MAAIRVEECAFRDPRFVKLAKRVGLADGDHARGKLEHVWSLCTERETYVLDEEDFDIAAGVDGIAAACCLPEVGLAEWVQPAGSSDAHAGSRGGRLVRVKGTEGRIDWLGDNRAAARAGGLARAATAKRDEHGRMVASTRPASSQPAGRSLDPAQPAPSSALATALATALAPALATAQEKDPPLPPKGGRRGVPPAVVRKATESVVGAFNRAFNRQLGLDGWEKGIERLLAKGYTEPQMRGVVWWAATEWAEDPEYRDRLTPTTLLKLQSSQGYRTFPEYLSCASERWRETHDGKPPPWESELEPQAPLRLVGGDA